MDSDSGSEDGANPLSPTWLADRELLCPQCTGTARFVCVDCAAALSGAYCENELVDALQYKIGALLLSSAGPRSDQPSSGFFCKHADHPRRDEKLREAEEFLTAALTARERRHRCGSHEDSIDALSALSAVHFSRNDHGAAAELAEAAMRHRLRLTGCDDEALNDHGACELNNLRALRHHHDGRELL